LPPATERLTMPPMFNHATAAAPRPVVERAEQANSHHVLGGSLAVRLDQEQTAGSLGLVERTIPAGYPGPAMHVHPDFDETFYVISGEIALRIGEDATVADAGSVAFVPRGTPHPFANPGPAPARMLVLLTPGGFEAYFNALAEVLRTAGGLPEPSELVTLGIAHGSLPA
jgi:quercetin dioxygenase-like cupin family protein